MTKRLAIVALALMFVVSVVGFAFSAEEKMMQHTGTITAIDAKAKTVTMKDAKGVSSTVTQVDEKVLATLKVGDEVECKHIVKDGKNICKGMMKVKKEGKPAGAPPAKAPGY